MLDVAAHLGPLADELDWWGIGRWSPPLDLSDESAAAGAHAVCDYAHATVRDEDYRLVENCRPTASPVPATNWCWGATSLGFIIATSRGSRL
jgi:hypothetical protein